MTTSPIRLRGLDELIATLPLQLGYQPEDSLVLLLFNPPEPVPGTSKHLGHVRMTCRLDLPQDLGSFEEVIATIARLLQRQRPAMVDLIAFEDEVDSTDVLNTLVRLCAGEEVTVQHVARVRDGRCQERGPDGEASAWREVLPVDRVPAAADLVLAGHTIGPGRPELDRWIREGDERRRAVVGQEADEVLRLLALEVPADETQVLADETVLLPLGPRCLERAARAWRRILDDTPEGPQVEDLAPAVLAQAVVPLANREFRDGLITWLAPGMMGPGLVHPMVTDVLVRQLPIARVGHRQVLDRLLALCALVPDDLAPPVLTATGQAAWAFNNGTLANLTIGRALELAPDYTLADLTDKLLQHAVPPPRGPFASAA